MSKHVPLYVCRGQRTSHGNHGSQFHNVGPRDQTQGFQFSSKDLYLQSHLTATLFLLNFICLLHGGMMCLCGHMCGGQRSTLWSWLVGTNSGCQASVVNDSSPLPKAPLLENILLIDLQIGALVLTRSHYPGRLTVGCQMKGRKS